MEIYLATENEGKKKEILGYLEQNKNLQGKIVLKTLADLPTHEKEKYTPVESGDTFMANARIKAALLNRLTGTAVIADDSGLEVDHLGGAPGVFSSRYEKTDQLRIERLLKELKGVPSEKRTARFVSSICFIDSYGNETYFNGRCEGLIAGAPSGNQGFGYDPVFYSPELGKTFAEAKPEEKNSISHRGRALALLNNFLITHG